MRSLFINRRNLWVAILFLGIIMMGVGVYQLSAEIGEAPEGTGGALEGTGAVSDGTGAVSEGTGGNPLITGGAVEVKDTGNNRAKTEKSEFFVEYRLERDRTRSQQIDLLREIVDNQHSPEETRKEAQRRMLAISQAIETEMKLENLIRAEDFKDAVVFIQEKSVTIIVQTPALTALDKKSLAETAVRVTGLNVENIIIIPKM